MQNVKLIDAYKNLSNLGWFCFSFVSHHNISQYIFDSLPWFQ